MLSRHAINEILCKTITIGTMSTALIGLLAIQQPKAVYAGLCLDVWNDDCDIIPDDVMPEVIPSQDFFDVYVRNNIDRPILVAVTYYREGVTGRRTSCSTVDGSGEDCYVGGYPSEWVTEGYWRIQPGERAFILGESARIRNRLIYFHAHTEDGQTYWGSANRVFSINGTQQPFLEADMGGSISVFTQGFSY